MAGSFADATTVGTPAVRGVRPSRRTPEKDSSERFIASAAKTVAASACGGVPRPSRETFGSTNVKYADRVPLFLRLGRIDFGRATRFPDLCSSHHSRLASALLTALLWWLDGANPSPLPLPPCALLPWPSAASPASGPHFCLHIWYFPPRCRSCVCGSCSFSRVLRFFFGMAFTRCEAFFLAAQAHCDTLVDTIFPTAMLRRGRERGERKTWQTRGSGYPMDGHLIGCDDMQGPEP